MMAGERGLLKTFLIWALPAALFLVLIVGGFVMIQQYTTTSPRFQIKKVEVLTDGPASKEELIKLANIPYQANLFALDLNQVKARLETHPWIASASVSRALPDRLIIRYNPQIPVALLNANGLYYVNSQGKVFSRVRAGDALQYPLFQIDNLTTAPEKLDPERVKPAVELLELLEKSKVFANEDISEVTIKSPEDHGGVALSLMSRYPPKGLHGSGGSSKKHLVAIQWGEDELPAQLKRVEAVLKTLNKSGKQPKLVRLELGKKVVVKINQ